MKKIKYLICRTYPSILKSDSYNIQEFGLARALRKRGIEADVVLYNGWNKPYKEQIAVDSGEEFFTVYYLRSLGILKNGFFAGLNKLVKEYDVVQVHEYDQITSWWYYTGKFKNKIVIYHGPYFDNFNRRYNFKCKIFDNTFLKFRSNPGVTAFTKSNAAADFLKKKGFENTVTVGVGLEKEIFRKVLDSRRQIETDDGNGEGALSRSNTSHKICVEKNIYTFVYVGKIERRRNSIFLMRLFGALMEKHENTKVIVVGNGDDEYKREAFACVQKWISSGRMEYYQAMSQQDLAGIYAKSDCMLFPSNYEIFGMVLMEAMYMGVPVISSNNGGADTLIRNGENGFILDNFDENEWMKACEKLMDDRELQLNIKHKLMSERDLLGWEPVAERIIEKLYS